MSQTLKFNMDMTCDGCTSAAKRVLKNAENIENVEASYETKTVLVTTTQTADYVLEFLKKTGKTVTYVGTV